LNSRVSQGRLPHRESNVSFAERKATIRDNPILRSPPARAGPAHPDSLLGPLRRGPGIGIYTTRILVPRLCLGTYCLRGSASIPSQFRRKLGAGRQSLPCSAIPGRAWDRDVQIPMGSGVRRSGRSRFDTKKLFAPRKEQEMKTDAPHDRGGLLRRERST